MEQRVKGGCVINPQGVLVIAKKKDGHRSVQATKRVQTVLSIVSKASINPLAVLKIAKKSSAAAIEERRTRKEGSENKLGYNGPKTFEEAQKSEQAKPSRFDANNCLAIKGGGEE
jgi:hypothetical protein